MQDILFYIFATLALVCGALVILSRNPVNSAMFLVCTMISIAGLFVLLQAFFLAAVQLIVYAGAVIVLFLFVIMLLDLKEEQRRKIKTFGMIGGILSVLAIDAAFFTSLKQTALDTVPSLPPTNDTRALGHLLFTNYTLPFEILSILLLVAMVGVILLSKKDLK
jgi:NADH-quinone oxidoreductase subunit J